MNRLGSFLLAVGLHVLIVGLLVAGSRREETPAQSPSSDGSARSVSEETVRKIAPDPDVAEENRRPSALTENTFRTVSTPMPGELAEEAQRICTAGVVVDWTDKAVLWRHHAAHVLPIASLTKMMTALIVAQTVRNSPAWAWEREVPVTRDAWRIGGSQVWLDPREAFTVDELLKSMMIFSANDAAYLLAEAIGGGDVAAFVERMNRAARRIGLETMRFANPHGLPESDASADNRGTALECAFLAGRLLDEPRIVQWASTRLDWLRQDTDKPLQLLNRNPLVRERVPGVNGMKTGYTERAGFCIAATCSRGGRDIVVVLLGCDRKEQRNRLAQDLLEWVSPLE